MFLPVLDLIPFLRSVVNGVGNSTWVVDIDYCFANGV